MTIFQRFYNNKFCDVFSTAETFLTEYKNNGIATTISDETATTLYYLLFAKYGNSTIANSDNNQFKYKVFSIIWQHGGTWQKKTEIQRKLQNLSLEDNSDIYKGARAIYNSAYNPETIPSTKDIEEIPFISSQNTTGYKKSKLDGLALLNQLLDYDYTNWFLLKFKDLFIKVIAGDTLYYATQEEE